jgi:hypothetical protein
MREGRRTWKTFVELWITRPVCRPDPQNRSPRLTRRKGAEMGRPPPGGRAGVAERSGSGGVEPGPSSKKVSGSGSNQESSRPG